MTSYQFPFNCVLICLCLLADRTDGYTPLGCIGCVPVNHLDAVYDWTDTEAQGAAGAAICHKWEVGLWVKCYGLISRIIAGHVTFATVDTHLFIYEGLDLLYVVKFLVCSNVT